MRGEAHLLAGLVVLASPGCAAYHPRPLEPRASARASEPPSLEALRVEAERISHPLLAPVTIDLRNGISPDEAAVIAVLANPSLNALRTQRGVAAAQLFQAGILPNPELSFDLELPVAGPPAVTALTGGLGWDIQALITRGARVAAAAAHARSVDLQVAWQEWQVAQSAKQHIYRLYFLGLQLASGREDERGLRENVAAVQRGVLLGYMTLVDSTAAEATLRRVHATVLTIEQQRQQERLALNQTLGFPPEYEIALQAGIEPPQPEAMPAFDELAAGLERRRLDLLALQQGYASQEATVRAAILAQFPPFSLGPTASRDNSDIVGMGLSLVFGLPILDRNQGVIAVARATREQLFYEYVLRLFEARASLASILANMRSIEEEIDAGEASVTALAKVVRVYHKALLEGTVDALTYYNARDELFLQRLDVLGLKQQLADNFVALEIAAGRYLAPAAVERPR